MRPSKKRWLLLGISCLWLSAACTPKPPDVPVCESLTQHVMTDPTTGHVLLAPSPTCMAAINEPECGHCVYIVSGKEVYLGEEPEHTLDGKTWGSLKAQSILLPAVESYEPIAVYIIDSCKKAHCSQTTGQFKAKLDQLDATKAN